MTHDLTALKRRFDIPGSVTCVAGPAGLPAIELRAASGQQATVALFGAHIQSWKMPVGHELLFTSSKADLSGKRAIRGGIPVIFPQFSNTGPLPAHGFARTASWELTESYSHGGGATVQVVLQLTDTEKTREIWPHAFRYQMEIEIGDTLTQRARITNTGTTPFPFQIAFHTYFAVGDISKVRVKQLAGVTYLDQLAQRSSHQETAEEIAVSREVDRIYCKVPSKLTFFDAPNILHVSIDTQNLPDAVLWNPWIEKSKSFTDLAPEEYKQFICLEPGVIEQPVELAAGASYSAEQTLSFW